MDTEVLDLIADDGAGVQKQNATYHWDKARKQPQARTSLLIIKGMLHEMTSLNVRRLVSFTVCRVF